ncbi:uncharacterized protein DUF1446 [Hydrogenispora ethanolica]|jgi:hypothetical protein|uniref:Uncharacterized protein DUF1446 n=1 Tax=Hydrogenispora ethanolica TaxID=1082276 RepID=A0A4R1R9T8_HYDET|nr:acyclic terpene utilization AtuA family protein [Hydrogenispora ethanolica]TCL62455.1 uncharacterized protein DUF1446 [Hydrogenispora ethanolica]
MEEMRILSPTAILGYGFPQSSFEEGLRRRPDVIAVDAGSTDPGPYYLGSGVCFTDPRAVRRDLTLILEAALERRIPVIIGSAGGSGGTVHLQRDLGLLREIAAERGWRFRVAVIGAEIAKETVEGHWRAGKVSPLPPAPELTEDDIRDSVRIVAQMGLEPVLAGLATGADVVLAGRCYDPAVFAAKAVQQGFDPGPAVHLGKILECAAIAATPGSGSDCLLGYLYPQAFEVEPLNPARRCTTLSVAAHTLYEKSNPYLLPGPGGTLDLRETRFEQVGESRVRVSGSRFVRSDPYKLKLEGVRRIGYRTVAIAGVRDPVMIREIDAIIAGVRERVADNFKSEPFTYRLDFKVYGKNGVMGGLEPHPAPDGHELGMVIEAVADTQDWANTICGFARSTMLHFGYPGRIATAGNLAFPYSPSDFKAGEVYAFSIYHLMEVDDPCQYFPVEVVAV